MNKYTDVNDAVLVQDTLLGNKYAFEELVVRYQKSVIGAAFKITKNRFSAEDAASDAFLSAWTHLDCLREYEKFGPWVARIARNCAVSLVTRYSCAAADISLNLLENVDFEGSSEDDIIELICKGEPSEELNRRLAELSEKIRTVINLHYFEGLTVEQIANRLSLPAGTVKWRLSEGRKQLRKGYGIMEKTYDENENLVARVMRMVEQMKLWGLKNSKEGFESVYNATLAAVEELDDSKEKSHALADVLLRGIWWISGKKNEEIVKKIKEEAEKGRNEDVLMDVMGSNHSSLSGEALIKQMTETDIPYCIENGFVKLEAYVRFWLARQYFFDSPEKAREQFEKVTELLKPSDIYYANAKSAVRCLDLTASQAEKSSAYFVNCTAESYKIIDGKLYFWSQPGFEIHIKRAKYDRCYSGSLFYWFSLCDSIIFDPEMKTGDTKKSTDGSTALKCLGTNEKVVTPYSEYDGCSVFEMVGSNIVCKTWFCPGIGAVKQELLHSGKLINIYLKSFSGSSDGDFPFVTGNVWEYAQEGIPDTSRYEVISFENNTAIISQSTVLFKRHDENDFCDVMLDACSKYFNSSDELCDVSDIMQKALKLAETKRQKLHAALADGVMKRIFTLNDPDSEFVGRWNFFDILDVGKNNGKVNFGPMQNFHFEWKLMPDFGRESNKVLYVFFMEILNDAMDCVWSDEWKPGYSFTGVTNQGKKSYPLSFTVLDETETVETPAGRFEGVLHAKLEYRAEISSWNYYSGNMDYWFAPGVGIVKYSRDIDPETENIWELTDYRGTADGYFPACDGIFRRYEPKNLGGGWKASSEFYFDEDETGLVVFTSYEGMHSRKEYEAETAANDRQD